HNRFVLAELDTEIMIARTFLNHCIVEHNAGRLTVADAAKAKWWTTELQNKVADRCVQLHGGYGYMREYPIAKAWLDGRVQTIYGGTTEIMKEIIGRSLGLCGGAVMRSLGVEPRCRASAVVCTAHCRAGIFSPTS